MPQYDSVLGQSQEILSHINGLEVDKPSFLYRNIPQFNVPMVTEKKIKSEITLVYAGLLGVAQGLNEICARIKLPPHVTLHIYGAGPEAIAIRSVTNDQIRYHGEIDRESLHKELQQYDIAFIPLINRIYGSVPSKIFEFSMLGLPLLYFAGGEGEDIVKKNNLGWSVSVSGIDELQQFLNSLTIDKLKEFPKSQVQANAIKAFNFKAQFVNLLKIIESY